MSTSPKYCLLVFMFCCHLICILLAMVYLLLCLSCHNSSTNMQGVAMEFKISHRSQFRNYCCHKGNNNPHLLMAVWLVFYSCDGNPPLGCLSSFKAFTHSLAFISKFSQLYDMFFWINRGLRVLLSFNLWYWVSFGIWRNPVLVWTFLGCLPIFMSWGRLLNSCAISPVY